MKRSAFFICLVLILQISALCGKNDSLAKPFHRNTISINPTPAVIFSNVRNITLRYERLVKDNQSVVTQAGFLFLDPFIEDSAGGFINFKRKTSYGLNLAFDYRFYMLKRNKFPAPDGLYIGPYISYYGFKFIDDFSYHRQDTIFQSGQMTGAYSFFNVGFEIGYQMIFWKRLSVDLLIFGPSLTYALSKWVVSDYLSEEERDDLASEVKEKFNEKYPLLVPFIHPDTETQSASFRLLLRYSISVGFHF